MSTKAQQKSKQWDIHDYDRKLELLHIKAKKDLSKRNLILFQDYDKSMVRIPLSNATMNPKIRKEWKQAHREYLKLYFT